MNWSKILLGLFGIALVVGGVSYLRPSDAPESGKDEPMSTASLSSSRDGDHSGHGDVSAEKPGAREVVEEAQGEWNPPIQQSIEDAKDFDKNYAKALSHENFEYAAQLVMRKKCSNLEAGPESEDCLPFLREKIRDEERLFQSDDLANFYIAAESDTGLKKDALNAIERINPRFFKEREPCLQWRLATDVEARAGFAGECIKVLVKLEAVGEAETSYWEEYTHLKSVNPARAETFRSEMSSLLPDLGSPGRGQKSPVAGKQP